MGLEAESGVEVTGFKEFGKLGFRWF